MRQSNAMIAILGGLGAAFVWATAALASARSSRLIGPDSVVAWAMLMGLVIALPVTALSGPPPEPAGATIVAFVVAGLSNIIGLLLAYRGLRIGKIGIVTALISTEGAIAAAIAILAGEPVSPATVAMLGVIVVGVMVVAFATHDESDRHDALHPVDPAAARRAAAFGIGAAIAFGLNLYAIGQVGIVLPATYAVLPARVAGAVLVFLPLALTGRLRLTRQALPLVLLIAIAEVVGIVLYALGARESIAVAAIIGSQFAAVAAVAAFVLFGSACPRRSEAGSSRSPSVWRSWRPFERDASATLAAHPRTLGPASPRPSRWPQSPCPRTKPAPTDVRLHLIRRGRSMPALTPPRARSVTSPGYEHPLTEGGGDAPASHPPEVSASPWPEPWRRRSAALNRPVQSS